MTQTDIKKWEKITKKIYKSRQKDRKCDEVE